MIRMADAVLLLVPTTASYIIVRFSWLVNLCHLAVGSLSYVTRKLDHLYHKSH